MMRRIAYEFGSDASDLLKYNQLMVSCVSRRPYLGMFASFLFISLVLVPEEERQVQEESDPWMGTFRTGDHRS